MSWDYEELYRAAVDKVANAFVDLMTDDDGSFIKVSAPYGAPGFASRLADLASGRGAAAAADAMNTQASQIGELQSTIGRLKGQHMNNAVSDWLSNRGGKYLAGIGTAGAIAAPLAYMAGNKMGLRKRRRDRNMAFGAGLATGMAAPGFANAGIQRGLGALNQRFGYQPQHQYQQQQQPYHNQFPMPGLYGNQ